NFSLVLNSRTNDADVELRDQHGNRVITSSRHSGTTPDAINRQLNAGTYWVRVFPKNPWLHNTYYNLSLRAT
ncbi:hypothetical protein V6O07_13890, partial [Arthrospira platensis SPKY2]